MPFRYPYRSQINADLPRLRKGRDYSVWREADAKNLVGESDGPIVEIGGPSDLGYFFLEGVGLKSKPVITNISDSPAPYAQNPQELAGQVQEIVDGRDMPYKDNTVGIFLISYMSSSSDWWTKLDEASKEKASAQFEAEADAATLEADQVALGVLKPGKAKYAQKVQIFSEVYRTLKPHGLLVANGKLTDMVVLQRLGFELIAFLQMYNSDAKHGLDYEFVVVKLAK